MGQPTQMAAVMLPVEEGRRMLARAQQRIRDERVAMERRRANHEREERNRRTSAATLVKKSRKGTSTDFPKGILAAKGTPC